MAYGDVAANNITAHHTTGKYSDAQWAVLLLPWLAINNLSGMWQCVSSRSCFRAFCCSDNGDNRLQENLRFRACMLLRNGSFERRCNEWLILVKRFELWSAAIDQLAINCWARDILYENSVNNSFTAKLNNSFVSGTTFLEAIKRISK